MTEQNNKLGYSIFHGLEQNEYLREIYDALLHNYFLRLFHIDTIAPKEMYTEDALRFADLLSKSVQVPLYEMHRSLAQEIVTLLNQLTPGDKEIEYVMGSVLASTNNYLGLQHSTPDFQEAGLLERLSEETIKEYLRIPSEQDKYFLSSQKEVFDHMVGDSFFSYSGPTSMGKSFVMRTFIREQIKKESKCNFAVIIPTKALINEVSKELSDNLGSLLRAHDYRIVTSAGAAILQDKNEHKYIFVMTPERLMYQLIGYSDIPIHYLFIDEAQKISDKEGRSAFYYQIVEMLYREEPHPHIIFASPHIPNPGVYLELVPTVIAGERTHYTSTYTPVSQEKFLIDIRSHNLGYYNPLTQELHTLASFDPSMTLQSFLIELGAEKKNLVYCNAKWKVVEFAREYADALPVINDPDLIALADEIREEIHDRYYLADTIERGVAYHVGYLPTSIRLRIEELFRKRDGGVHTIFCTSTLLEGVNLPADNLFITDYKNGSSPMSAVEFRNLIGRVGRLQYSLYGNAFLVCLPNENTEPQNYVTLLRKDIELQILSINTISNEEKEYIRECLKAGKTKLEKLSGQTDEDFALMRKTANILLRDIMLGRKGRISREFEYVITAEDIVLIKKQFTGRKTEPDDDINLSLDQVSALVNAIEGGLKYPRVDYYGNINYQATLDFLEKLCEVFDWEIYESGTLGYIKDGVYSKLRFYANFLIQWLSGKGTKYMIEEAINYKRGKKIYINHEFVPFVDCAEHYNKVVEETLNDINVILLFRLSNYFMRVSTELKKYTNKEYLTNDWYEYVEYGTTDKTCILLQKNGFSSEVATYIHKHESQYVEHTEDGIKLNMSVLACSRRSVQEEAKAVYSNVPELFINDKQ